MFFSLARLSLTAAALLLPIHAQAVAFTVDSFKGIAVGKPTKLTWSGDKTPVTIKLMQGPPEALEPVVSLASNVAGESYTWTPTTIPAGTYVLSITQGTETNYSPQFQVANTFTPSYASGPAGTKPSTKATPGAAPPAVAPGAAPGAVPPGAAADHVPPSAVIAAYYPPAGYNNGSTSTCASDPDASERTSTFAAFPCASSVKPTLGHFPSLKGGVGKTDVAVGAAVVGMAFAVVLVL